MRQTQLETSKTDRQQEAARLAVLSSIGILDTAPEASYDAITRLTAEYFHADSAGIGFGDESRVWIKSSWGPHLRELPRENSIFDLVLAADGPVVIADISRHPAINGPQAMLRLLNAAFIAGAPVRSSGGKILGVLTIFAEQPRQGMTPDELRMLESLADLVSANWNCAGCARPSAARDCGGRASAGPNASWAFLAALLRSAPRSRPARVRALLPA